VILEVLNPDVMTVHVLFHIYLSTNQLLELYLTMSAVRFPTLVYTFGEYSELCTVSMYFFSGEKGHCKCL